MRSFVFASTSVLGCCLSFYGCTVETGTNGSGGTSGSGTGGAGGTIAGSSGKSSGGTSGKGGNGGTSGSAGAGEGGEAGVSLGGGGTTSSGQGGTGGKGGSARGGQGGSGGTSSSAAGEAGAAGEMGAAGSEPSGPQPFVCQPASPGDVTWSDGFESGGTDWDITGGVWAIGAPTASDGPLPFEGTNVAGTVLGGDYGPNSDAWLISPELDVPAAKEHPRFAFRYWFELAPGDTGYVNVRTEGGSWQQVFTITQSGDGNWHNVVIPLDAYADQKVQFGFRLFTDSAANAAGFYVDDTRFLTGDIGMGNCENFENGWDQWSDYSGVWDIGKPPADDGPSALEGTELAGTILSGDYESNQDAWLVSPEIAVPKAAQEPRFGFDYWYDLAAGDTGYTYIRVNHGPWQSLAQVNQGGDDSWRHLSIPLNAYADETVELGFRFFSDSAATAGGYYIDDVRFETGAPVVNTNEGFEDGWDGWSAYNGVWAVGKPTAANGPSPHGGKAVAGTILSGDYPINGDAWLVSPRIAVPESATHAKASYWYWYDLAASDTAYAYIRVDGGPWQNVDTLSAMADDTWRQHQLDLSSYVNHTIELGFRLFSDSSAVAPGFYIDDVTLSLE